MNGKGTWTFSNGETYDGDFKDGYAHGKGMYTYPDGGKCEGDFKDGYRHGRVSYADSNGKTEISWFKTDCEDIVKTKEERAANKQRLDAAAAAEKKRQSV